MAAQLLHLEAIVRILNDVLLRVGKFIFFKNRTHAAAPSAVGLQVGCDFRFVHLLRYEGSGREGLLFRLSGTIFVFRELEGLVETDHVFSRTQGIECFGFLAESFLAVVGSFDREADAALSFVHLDDAGFDFLTDFEHVLDFLDTVFADLRDVHEAVDVVLELDEGSEVGEFCDGAFDEIADAETAVDFLPRIGVDLFDAETDALVRLVDD